MKNLQDLFEHQLKDLYSAEKQLLDFMPKIIEATTSSELSHVFTKHQEQTLTHFNAVNDLLNDFKVNPTSTKCKAMEGLIEEAKGMVNHDATSPVKDAGLIAAFQRIEHYEIAGYGTAKEYAKALNHHDAEAKLNVILQEEQSTDTKLNELARFQINKNAL